MAHNFAVYRLKDQKQFLMEVASPDDMLMDLLNTIVVSGNISTAAFIHDDQFGEKC